MVSQYLQRAVVEFVENPVEYTRKPDVIVEMPLDLWTEIFNNTADPGQLIAEKKIRVTKGDAAEAKRLFSLFDPFYDWRSDPALKAFAELLKAGETGK